MPPTFDITGQRFGRLTVVRRDGSEGGRSAWVCRCDCGKEMRTLLIRLRSGNTRSCGCLGPDITSARNTTHGFTSQRGPKHPLVSIWASMLTRCTNPHAASYPHYGGRGIRVCEQWRDLAAFVADIEAEIGARPSMRHSLDRINNDRHYEPGNVRWATRSMQRRNSRSPLRLITIGGRTMSQTDWARETGVPLSTIRTRLRRGLSPELAIGRTA